MTSLTQQMSGLHTGNNDYSSFSNYSAAHNSYQPGGGTATPPTRCVAPRGGVGGMGTGWVTGGGGVGEAGPRRLLPRSVTGEAWRGRRVGVWGRMERGNWTSAPWLFHLELEHAAPTLLIWLVQLFLPFAT